jgi:3-oxoacyl-[acyl-carrier protein] reductase
MDLRLNGKVALVTGGSQGIGRATAECFASEGAAVAICGRREGVLAETAAKLKSLGAARVLGIPADVSEAAGAERLIAAVGAEFGGLDILINNVGGGVGGVRLLESSDEDWRRTLEINLVQTARLMRLAVPLMRGREGAAIVNIASISGWMPQVAGTGQYGAAKAALIFDTERWALEFVPYGIRVNTVSPGSIWGPGNGWDRYRATDPEGYADYVRHGFPMGRLGKLEEVADAIVFLASPRANWINGRNLPVDGLEQPYAARHRRPY